MPLVCPIASIFGLVNTAISSSILSIIELIISSMEKCATYIVGVVPWSSWSAKAVAMRGEETGARRCGHGTSMFRNIHSSFSKDNLDDHRERSSSKRILRPMLSSNMAQHLFCIEKTGDDDDDTTCSTTSSSETEEDELSNSSLDEDDTTSVYGDCRSKEEDSEDTSLLLRLGHKKSVSFATPLITDIHFRPRTLRQDKATLYYGDADYRFFRRDAYREAKAANDANIDNNRPEEEEEGQRRVRFASSQVVTTVWEYDYERDDALFWYSEAEIQKYVCLLVLSWPCSCRSRDFLSLTFGTLYFSPQLSR
jgi:hypothetical protein